MMVDKHPRVVASDEVRGGFMLPMGLHLFRREPEPVPSVTVSTVRLDGAHLEDPAHWLEPETGYETMVFLDGCTFFSLYTAHYKTRRAAIKGHKAVLEQLHNRTLKLAVSIDHYWTYVPSDAALTPAHAPVG